MGIIVDWTKPADPGEEHIDGIDPDNREGCPDEMQTEFWDPEKGVWTTWKVRVEPPTDDGTVFVVKYEREKNPHLLKDFCDDGYWGETRIIVEPGKDRGDYCWTGISGDVFDSEVNKRAGWRKKELREPRNHRRSTQQIRDEKFRPQIIALDRKCVITGETTKAALDAAHIIPAAKDGNEIRDNGIALRADIHRLYDEKMFFIDPKSGKLKINDKKNCELSPEYNKLLNESKGLPRKTLGRVRKALKEVWPGD